ncbi:hypothetical protein BLA29_001558 [Euroglyphus maynei]|uniref:Gustatory receptor-like protein n=1 Tax=Euroglyphus maynei TaxID=6958 RepID=A0A1Y3BU32_EURMA|nr:hypothetical protein BLA29_001558 [Euroglyphus maynei]
MNASYACSVMYHIPIFIVIVQYYLGIKQRTLEQRIGQFHRELLKDYSQIRNKTLWKWYLQKALKEICQIYGHQVKEIYIHNDQMTRIISILYGSLMLVITYSICIIFWIPLSTEFLILYSTIESFHVFILIMLIYGCSKVEQQNYRIVCLKHKFQMHSNYEGVMLVESNNQYVF